MKNIEIEIQVKLQRTKPLIDFLESNAKIVGIHRQNDEYFTPKHRNFLAKKQVNEWLRLRNSNGKHSINYKNWYYAADGRSHHCDEFETLVDDIEIMQKILSSLDFKKICEVNKVRMIYLYKDYEIAIDKVKNLGNFVEIEYKGNSKKDPAEIAQKMVKFLKSLKIGKIHRNYVGYAYMAAFPNNEIKWEEL